MTNSKPVRILICSVLFLCFPFGPVWARENRILVLPFYSEPITEEEDVLGQGLVDLIQVFLSEIKNLEMVERAGLKRILDEHGLSLKGMVTSDESARLGKLAKANRLLTGSYHVEGARIYISAHLFEVESSRILASARDQGPQEELAGMVKGLLKELFSDDWGAANPSIFEWDHSPLANLQFMRGLSHYFSANYNQAVSRFIGSSREENIHELSRFWLAKSYLAQGDYPQAYVEILSLSGASALSQKQEELDEMREECLRQIPPSELDWINDILKEHEE